ncbi:hypothetical protein BDA99DRAFT_601625 [Phascolomyces articulosus]|uniref:MICOS complex subunit MIC19 n=1 Tax=Phascolomyces articulosus TaxID=60185 RepID=A0AAD5KKQ3_9FUNG|nr:hypothetical protein BDA99DRAFT_601625 [Phascolomyces articulosus]
MGTTQSKTAGEPVIIYNQNVPLQFSQGLVDSLETRKKSSENNARSEDVEEQVRKRVAEELERVKSQQGDLEQKSYSELAKSNIEKDHNSVAIGTDIENMIQRIQRTSPKEIPAEIVERQEAVVACYKKNASRPLDCWEEVEQFKETVSKAQKRFVAAHQ